MKVKIQNKLNGTMAQRHKGTMAKKKPQDCKTARLHDLFLLKINLKLYICLIRHDI